MNKIMTQVSIAITLIFSYPLAWSHGTHEHGNAKIDIGVENNTASIHLEVPAISIYGFEHEAKSENDKKTVEASVNKIRDNISQMVKLDSNLGCTFTTTKIDPFVKDDDEDNDENKLKSAQNTSNVKNDKKEAEHGEFKADFSVKCTKNISGTKITFGFKKYFPSIHKINVQGISSSTQSAAKISNDKGFIQL
ncbi:ZrgA family zinc uptake protein [Silvanigrella aquatica]|uniref:DUF2796 domain-containing protein n=1 Tax=Silvanigrella aquatica TaxID=1915309 RepID=A0A1L4D1E7_9BACT|nr:DUF2796 domain-containing protein [Silvanigrella aquatica]APJ04016.1 hypothetical protein AXG55_08890 [Silvanigrella aquatica]